MNTERSRLRDQEKQRPSKGNSKIEAVVVRSKKSFQCDSIRIMHESPSTSSLENSTKVPSPLYNTALLTSFIPKSYLLSVHAIQQVIPAFNDALALLRVWANQKGYGESGEGVSVQGFDGKGPWWAALLMYLVLGEETTSAGWKSGGRGKKKTARKWVKLVDLDAGLRNLRTHTVIIQGWESSRCLPTRYRPFSLPQRTIEKVSVMTGNTMFMFFSLPIKLPAIHIISVPYLHGPSVSIEFPELRLKEDRGFKPPMSKCALKPELCHPAARAGI
ncbi:hypothetical protein F5877DRAFT_83530 [Lentinula edodes]|nr:hypothetical protein F5877DRAFT_83530 [Lentinula edodes]